MDLPGEEELAPPRRGLPAWALVVLVAVVVAAALLVARAATAGTRHPVARPDPTPSPRHTSEIQRPRPVAPFPSAAPSPIEVDVPGDRSPNPLRSVRCPNAELCPISRTVPADAIAAVQEYVGAMGLRSAASMVLDRDGSLVARNFVLGFDRQTLTVDVRLRAFAGDSGPLERLVGGRLVLRAPHGRYVIQLTARGLDPTEVDLLSYEALAADPRLVAPQ